MQPLIDVIRSRKGLLMAAAPHWLDSICLCRRGKEYVALRNIHNGSDFWARYPRATGMIKAFAGCGHVHEAVAVVMDWSRDASQRFPPEFQSVDLAIRDWLQTPSDSSGINRALLPHSGNPTGILRRLILLAKKIVVFTGDPTPKNVVRMGCQLDSYVAQLGIFLGPSDADERIEGWADDLRTRYPVVPAMVALLHE